VEVTKILNCGKLLLALALLAPLTANASRITTPPPSAPVISADVLGSVVVDFEIDTDGNALSAGDVISDNLASILEVSTDTRFPAIIFDSANPTGGDYDLATSTEGNILIISENRNFSNPDDNARGGAVLFTFNQAVSFDTLTLVDIEENGGAVTGITESGQELALFVIPGIGDNSIQTLINPLAGTSLTAVEVTLEGSGAISEFSFTPQVLTGPVNPGPGPVNPGPVNPGPVDPGPGSPAPGNPGTEVPEPSTWALLLVSTFGLLARKRFS